MEAIITSEEIKEFTAPKTKEDFPEGKTQFEHVYPNGNKVIFLLLDNGQVATIRQGKGRDVEMATLESDGNRNKYMSALTASCVKIGERQMNMHELADVAMKDYLAIQTAFAELNF